MPYFITLLLLFLPGFLAAFLHCGLRKQTKEFPRLFVYINYTVILDAILIGFKLVRGASIAGLFTWFYPPLSFAFYLTVSCAMAMILPLLYVLLLEKRIALQKTPLESKTKNTGIQPRNGKRFLYTVGRMALVLIAGILIGAILVTAVYLLPIAPIQQNVLESAATISEEGSYPFLYSNWRSMRLDNFTDSIMMLIAAYPGDQGVIGNAMLSTYVRFGESDPAEGLVQWSTGTETGMFTHSYSRYWHGYLVWLKPLLEIMNYRQIRVLNTILQILLVLAVLLIMVRKGWKRMVLPFGIMYLFLTPIALFKSFQFSWVFYVLLAATLILLLRFDKLEKTNRFSLLFMVTGMATSYVDFLTYPLITLGIPLVMYLVMHDSRTMRQGILDVITLAIVWGIGYVGMWAGKWLLCTLLTGSNVLESVQGNITARMSFDYAEESFNIVDIIKRNIEAYNQWIYMAPFLICLFAYGLRFGRERVSIVNHNLVLNSSWLSAQLIPLLLVALSPFAWFLIASNHTYIHYWFAHRTLAVSAFAVLAVFVRREQAYKELNKAD